MRVLVFDTSTLVELGRGSLLEACFRLPGRFVVPDLLYERELKGRGGEELVRLGLVVEELDGNGLTRALAMRHNVPALSLPDSFAMALAQVRTWLLLTDDDALRKIAGDEAVACHGMLWLLDEIHRSGAATVAELHNGLTAISRHPRCRLRRAEVQRRLTAYAGASS